MSELRRLEINARRAETIHRREQLRGDTDGSVAQTKKMYHAIRAMQNAAGKLHRARLSLRLIRGGKYPVCRQTPCRHGDVQ